MDALMLTWWGDGHRRGWLELSSGRIAREERGDWRLAQNGFYLLTDAGTAALYREGDSVWWQLANRRIKLGQDTGVALRRAKRHFWSRTTKWHFEVSNADQRLECTYRCPTLQEMIDTDPTFHADDYSDFNVGVLVMWLLHDPQHLARWLRPQAGV